MIAADTASGGRGIKGSRDGGEGDGAWAEEARSGVEQSPGCAIDLRPQEDTLSV